MDHGRGSMNKEFVTTIPGILKIAETISSLLTFAIAAGAGVLFQYYGGGWVVFNGVLGFLVALTFFFLYFFNLYPDFLINYMIEPITNGVLAICYLISGIVAAARASTSPYEGYNSQAIGAASFFAFLSMVLFAVDAVLVFLSNRSAPRTTITTTTTTTTNVPSEYASQNAVY